MSHRVALVILLACCAAPLRLAAQRPVGLLPQWEARADASFTPVGAAHGGVGLNVRAGHYTRLGIAYMAGAAQGPAGDRDARFSQRADATVRFLLDPFAEQPRGLYGGAGFSVRRDGDEAWKGSLMLVVGVEGVARGRALPAVELALGAGLRAGVVLRSRRTGSYASR